MKINVCIAARGRMKELTEVVKSIDDLCDDPSLTTISVALDNDDETPIPPKPVTRCPLIWDIAPREDSLGAKYNRAATNCPADWYAMGADDNLFITPSWDRILRHDAAMFGNQPGFIYFGRMDGDLPTQMLLPHSLIDYQGFLFPPFWPFWFHDTWTDEIAHMCGRIYWSAVEIQEIGGRGRTRGLRDVRFWASFFEKLRPIREELANRISLDSNPPWLRAQLIQRRDLLLSMLGYRTEKLRNPATAIQYERRMSFDAPADERYSRIKASAEKLLEDMENMKQEQSAKELVSAKA